MTEQASGLLKDADDFLDAWGEQITVNPRSGGSRVIDAVVDRNPPRVQPEAGQGMTKNLDVIVKNVASPRTTEHPHGGYATSEVDRGGDTVTLAVRVGGADQTRPIRDIVDQDEGMARYELG